MRLDHTDDKPLQGLHNPHLPPRPARPHCHPSRSPQLHHPTACLPCTPPCTPVHAPLHAHPLHAICRYMHTSLHASLHTSLHASLHAPLHTPMHPSMHALLHSPLHVPPARESPLLTRPLQSHARPLHARAPVRAPPLLARAPCICTRAARARSNSCMHAPPARARILHACSHCTRTGDTNLVSK